MDPASPQEQVRDMRRAFYAGFVASLDKLSTMMSPGDSLDDLHDEELIVEVQKELAYFAADVSKGKA